MIGNYSNSILFYRNTKTHLQSLSCKLSKPFKCFNITTPYSFLFTRKFREYLFPKGVLIYHEKTTPRSIYFLGNYDWGVDISVQISTGELFFKGVYI